MEKLNESIIRHLNEGRNDDMHVGTVVSKKGSFYVGDPCYVLPDEIYHGIWGDKYNFEDGLIETPEGNWLVHGTAYGDGYYDGYPVDSGTLSVIPAELIAEDKAKDALRLGKIFPGKEASVDWVGQTGAFIVGIKDPNCSFDIITGEYEEDEENWDNNEEDWDNSEEEEY